MGIGSYKEAQRYRMRTNKNLTRGFYLDTKRTLDEEPFAWEQSQDAGIMQPGAVQGYADGGIVGDKEKLIKLIEDSNEGFKVDLFKDLALKAGYAPNRREASISLPVKLDTSKDKVIKAFEYISSDLNKPVEEFVDLPKKISDLTGVKGTYVSTLLQDNENFKNLKPALTYLASPASRAKVIGTDKLFSDIVNMYEQTPGKERIIGYASPEKKIMDYAERHSLLGGNKIKFTKPISEYGFEEAEFMYKGKKYNLDKLRYEGRKDKNFKEFYKVYDEKEKLLRKEVVHPITKEKVLFNELMQEAYEKGAGYKKTDVYDIDHIKGVEKDPFNNLRILTARTNQAAGALRNLESQAEKGVLKNTAQYYSPENVSKQLNKIGYNYTKDIDKLAEDEVKLAEDVLLKERKLRTPQAIAKEKISVTDLTNYLNNNPEEVKAFRTAGVVCRRSVGGKVDTECLAENIIKETEKLETGTDLQKASALNKFKNATKLGAGLAEEVIGFGKGVAGRTLGPLVALNSALEQFTSGNYREGVRKIASLADLTTLVGDPLGFEKMRTEGTIEDVRGKIGKENQASLDRILEFKDKYYQLQDINTKLERAESATQDPNAAPESYDPDYINQLKKQQNDLNQIINNPKYQNIRTDYLNVGNAVKNEIFKRNINAPEQNKYTFETAAQEQLQSILGYDFYDELSDENKIIFKNLTASEKIKDQPVPFENPIQSPDDSMREGFAEGGGPKIGRRGFLGLLTGAAAAPELIKAIKGGKKTVQAAKVASKIKLEPAEGMYSWFPDLIEKIKVKGKPFEEKEIIMEASYKHEAKGYGGLPKGVETVTRHVDGDTEFLLREYPDGRLAVDIHSPRNQEGSSTPVTLYYRPKMELKYYSGTKVEPAEFKVLEKEPRYFANGPDDVDIEMSETRKIPGKNTIYGDVEAAERFATGKIENRKIIPVKQARREQMEDAPTDFIEETSPYGPVYD
jgi:hypothetical protein